VNVSQQAACSRLFSSSVLREMAVLGKSALFARLVPQSLVLNVFNKSARVRDAFEAAFDMLRAVEYRDEYIYKAALTHKVLLGKHSLRTASMLSEFRVGDCKADLAIFNGTATVYEIKSERDTLTRLMKQLDAYRRVFASVYVIAGENHVASVMGIAPQDVGVLQLSKRYRISTVRQAVDDPERLCSITILDSLRVSEAADILSLLGLKVPTVPNTMLRSELQKVFAKIEPSVLHSAFVATIKKTRDLSALSELVDSLPPSLHAAALSLSLRKTERQKLLSAVNTPLDEALHWG
jgi:hypothetical protein